LLAKEKCFATAWCESMNDMKMNNMSIMICVYTSKTYVRDMWKDKLEKHEFLEVSEQVDMHVMGYNNC